MAGWLAVLALLAPGLSSCTDETASLTTLMLSITSDELPDGGRLQGLQFMATDGTARFPSSDALDEAYLLLSEEKDPSKTTVFMAVEYGGTTFKTNSVNVRVVGMRDGQARATWSGSVDLSTVTLVEVRLQALAADCDADKDGFADCSIAGCCAAGETLSDCDPVNAGANPWGVEPECEPCGEELDQDCKGGDQVCVDVDNDGMEDCREVAEDCGVGDPAVGPGFPELCDGIDNNCDGQIDEGLLDIDGLPLNAGCGLPGVCADGVIACDPEDPSAPPVCDKAPPPGSAEICNNGLDDDCNGQTDECEPEDVDGDGYLPGDGPDADCNDSDSAFHPGEHAVEPCCPRVLRVDDGNPPDASVLKVCDFNCDGSVSFCAPGDLDGDGYDTDDCDDTDKTIFPGAPEKCDDGIDQDCIGGDLPCTLVVDSDSDGYADDVDCDPFSDLIYPNAPELCDGVDNDCDTVIDDGNPGGGSACGLDLGLCSKGTTVCGKEDGQHGPVCPDDVGPQPERCDDLDHDCNGDPYGGLLYDGGDSPPSGVGTACDGIGACGQGVVECGPAGAPICSTDPGGSNHAPGLEVCDGIDNDCDGEVDENLGITQSTCLSVGVCGTHFDKIIATCNGGTWECDYKDVPGYEAGSELSCDGLNNDCDDATDEDFSVGTGCDGDDDDKCLNGTLQCNTDGSNTTFCSETGSAVEVCDGFDNDCDGLIDETFTTLGDPCDGPDPDSCADGQIVCGTDVETTECLETGPPKVELCNGMDDDCDGVIDNGFPELGTPCDGPDSDQCLNGVFTCAQDGLGVECASEDVVDIAEICDDIDNDCDGLNNEGVNPSLGQPCDGDDADSCAEGILECGPDGDLQNLVCSDDSDDTVEVCNGIDDDCNGMVDDGIVGSAADGGCLTDGVCGADTSLISATCNEGGAGTWTCDYSAVVGYGTEQCDTLDHDCDGLLAEDFEDFDGDATADCIDDDVDGDGVPNDIGATSSNPCTGGSITDCQDNCVFVSNNLQFDLDGDMVGDACDPDIDGDGILNDVDNCPENANPDQADGNGDGIGNACTTQTCVPGATRCDNDGQTVLTCIPSGDGETASSCAYMCVDGGCVVPTGTAANTHIGGCADGAPSLNSNWATGYVSGTQLQLCTSGGSCTSIPAVQESTSSSVPVVFCLSSLNVATGRSIVAATTPPQGPVVFLVDGDVTVSGSINFAGGAGSGSSGGKGGPGAGNGANQPGDKNDGGSGGGAGGGGGGEGGTNWYDAGGGGGGGFWAQGGGGGNGEEGDGGSPGIVNGNALLNPIQGGSGGGAGGDGSGGTNAGPGGGGGGAVHIVSRGTITVTGFISAKGGNGRSASGRHGGGGGGSGGAILLEALSMSIGSDKLDVRGGNGGSADGGNGGAGGSASTANGGEGANGGAGDGGAGGGGGVGRARLRSYTGIACTAVNPTQVCASDPLATP